MKNNRKAIALIAVLASCVLAAGCTTIDVETNDTETAGETEIAETAAETAAETVAETEAETEAAVDDGAYVGEYIDSDSETPNLEIARGEDGKYAVQIGVYRLASFTDGVGELTADGMTFTATDPSDGTISGTITVSDGVATVTFTDSTWGLLESGTSFEYTKTSDTPNLWME